MQEINGNVLSISKDNMEKFISELHFSTLRLEGEVTELISNVVKVLTSLLLFLKGHSLYCTIMVLNRKNASEKDSVDD